MEKSRVSGGLVEGLDTPASGSMLEAERESGARRVDLEYGPRPARERVCGGFVAHGGNAEHRQLFRPPLDMAGTSIEPICANANLDRLDANHGHPKAPFGRV
jgi:hypothetical protein